MKKLLICLAIFAVALTAIVSTSCSSCTNNSDNSIGFVYSLESFGDADGNFAVTFVNGKFGIDGKADYNFAWSNATDTTSTKFRSAPLRSLDNALQSTENEDHKAAVRANDWLQDNLQINSYSGTYSVTIKGYVMETLTGIKFEVNRTFTNREVQVDNSALAK